jgi:hypothetical protein
MPFIFSGRSTAKVLRLRKIVNKLGENGWNSSFGYKILSRVNSLGGNYFSISITRRALKRVWFILAARVLII